MSKKKSYMDRGNILSEGILNFLGKLVPLKNLLKSLSSKEKKLLKDPQVRKALTKFDKQYEKALKFSNEFSDELDKALKDRGIDY
jgi:hypothetical protein